MLNPVKTMTAKQQQAVDRSGVATVSDIGITLLHKGDHLYRMGDHLPGIYQVKVGSIKLYRTTECGDQQIVGFFMPGDVIGLDALPDGISRNSGVALDTTRVQFIPIDSILEGNEKLDSENLIYRMSAMINRSSDLVTILSQRTADRRLAWFLREYADGLSDRGLSPAEFTLPMTRTDIAIYLGLALETVCRELARLESAGILRKDRRRIYILDYAAMAALADGEELVRAKQEYH